MSMFWCITVASLYDTLCRSYRTMQLMRSLQWQTMSQKSTCEQYCGLCETSGSHRIPFLGLAWPLRYLHMTHSYPLPRSVLLWWWRPTKTRFPSPFPYHRKQSSVATHSWVLASPSRSTNGFTHPWLAASIPYVAIVASSKWTQTRRQPTLASEVHMLPYFDSMLLIRYLRMRIADYLSWKWDSIVSTPLFLLRIPYFPNWNEPIQAKES